MKLNEIIHCGLWNYALFLLILLVLFALAVNFQRKNYLADLSDSPGQLEGRKACKLFLICI